MLPSSFALFVVLLLKLYQLSCPRPGDYFGPAADWEAEAKLRLGTCLLFKAFRIFLQEGERQIRPVDLQRGA